ncbi:hypothetical protein EMIT0347P_10255 [Pseudomonas sp. IT-347P]
MLVSRDSSEPVQLKPALSVELGCEVVRTAIELSVPNAAGVVLTTEHAACAAPGNISASNKSNPAWIIDTPTGQSTAPGPDSGRR